MATNLQGSSHRPRAVGFRPQNRKGFIYEYSLAKDLLIASDHIYEKKFPSAFSNTSFVKDLENLNVTDIEVVGVDGNSCVKHTCIDALKAGYKVTLNRSCTAARNAKIYEKTLEELAELGTTLCQWK